MSTPRGAEHRDLEQWRRNVERQLRELTSRVVRREQLKVDSGDFAVSGGGDVQVKGGGSVLVQGGGGVTVEDGGRFEWYDANDALRMVMRSHVSEETGNELANLRTIGEGGGEAVIGATENTTTGVVREGLLVQNSDGSDVFAAVTGANSGRLLLTHSAKDYLDLRDLAGNVRAYLGPATWQGADDGWGLQLLQGDGTTRLFVSDTGMDHYGVLYQTGDQYWYDGSQVVARLTPNGLNTFLYGGASSNGNNFRELIFFNGNDSQKRTIRFKDGANSTYIPVEASSFDVSSSSELKDVDGDLDVDALDKVRRTRVKRWRYKARPADGGPDADPTASDEPDEQIGPLAEEAPAEVTSNVDDPDPEQRTISVNRSVWLLWAAVQQLADQVERERTEKEQLADTVHKLAQRVDRLEGRGR